MAQKYRVFIGEVAIWFAEGAEGGVSSLTDPDLQTLEDLVARCEEGSRVEDVTVSGDVPANWQHFCSLFQIIEAAGGVVLNDAGEWLMIHRLGKWDLPKGKLEEGESPEEASVREVSEECGIPEPELLEHLTDTYHVYTHKGKRILKRTYWYLMRSTEHKVLAAQTEEGITDVRWVHPNQVGELAQQSYGSIRVVIEKAMANTGTM